MNSDISTPESVGLSSERLSRTTQWMESQLSKERVAGNSLLIGRHGKVCYRQTKGYADIEAKKPFQEDTVVRIYSMTKPVTAVAAMMLYEEGRFKLDDPVASFIPEFADTPVWTGQGDTSAVEPQVSPVLVRHVMSHTAGLTYATKNQNVIDAAYREKKIEEPSPVYVGDGTFPNLEVWARNLADIPLLYQPGTRWSYGVASDLLGRLVEIWSGMSLDIFFYERIFEPLGMMDTGFHVKPENHDRLASLYIAERGSPYNPKPPAERGGLLLHDSASDSHFRRPVKVFSGGGGLVSTLDDYSRFCQMLVGKGLYSGEQLLSPVTLSHMVQNHLPDNLDIASVGIDTFGEDTYEGNGFGLGFAIVMDPVKFNTISSPGQYYWTGAGSTLFWIDPMKDMWGIYLSQLLPTPTYPIKRELRVQVYQALVD